jgi:hypothetical protein
MSNAQLAHPALQAHPALEKTLRGKPGALQLNF